MSGRVLGLIGAAALGLSAAAACGTTSDTVPAPVGDASDEATADGALDAGDEGEGITGRGNADLVILALSDWRGQVETIVEPDGTGIPRRYGGLPALATYFARERAQSPNTLVFSSGDAFGSTPLLSSATGDLLAAKGLALLGVTAGALGPHDFDRGATQLSTLLDVGGFRVTSTNLEKVIQVLGPRPVTPFLLVDVGTGDASAPIKVAVLGLTDWALAELQFASNLEEIAVRGTKDLLGTAAAANEAAANARLVGADLVVALANVGAGDVSGAAPTGPLIELAGQLKGIDLLFGGETDRAYATTVGGVTVVQNRNKGRTYARVKLHVEKGIPTLQGLPEIVEPLAYDVVRPVCGDAATCACPSAPCPDATHSCNSASGFCEAAVVKPDKTAQDLLQAAGGEVGPLLDTMIAVATDAFPHDATSDQIQETALGDLVADAMRIRYGTQLALVPGSRIFSPLPSAYKAPANLNRTTAPYDLVVGDVATFLLTGGDSAVVRQISGQALWQILEKSVAVTPTKDAGFLQVSGFSFTYTIAADAGTMRVKTVTLDGGKIVSPNDPTLYTVVLTDALSRGELGYPALAEEVPTLTRELLTDVVVGYVKAKTPLALPKTLTRIVKVP